MTTRRVDCAKAAADDSAAASTTADTSTRRRITDLLRERRTLRAPDEAVIIPASGPRLPRCEGAGKIPAKRQTVVSGIRGVDTRDLPRPAGGGATRRSAPSRRQVDAPAT